MLCAVSLHSMMLCTVSLHSVMLCTVSLHSVMLCTVSLHSVMLCTVSLHSVMLYTVAGLPPDKVIEAHGSFQSAACVVCHTEHDADSVKVGTLL
jgi:hypothetical protein